MSTSNEWTEWHLTSEGWLRGSKRMDFQPVKNVETPENRVKTCKYCEYQSSAFSSVNKSVSVEWVSDKEELIAELEAQYGFCPNRL